MDSSQQYYPFHIKEIIFTFAREYSINKAYLK